MLMHQVYLKNNMNDMKPEVCKLYAYCHVRRVATDGVWIGNWIY
jgi:hypothetical protein